MTYLAIDPGGTTGWALFDEGGDTLGFGKVKGHDNFLDWLEDTVRLNEPKVSTIILENYKVGRSGGSQFTHSFGDVPTLQLIGAIKRVAKKASIPIVEQSPNDMYMGLRHLGLWTRYRGDGKALHVPDDQSALAHGVWYLTKIGVRKHRLDERDSN